MAASFSTSSMNDEEIQKLVTDALLQPQEVALWRAALGESSPTPSSRELVVFKKFIDRGLGFPTCDFFCSLL